MPKIKRPDDERSNTDFIESLDRGLRVFELFGGQSRPMSLSDVAKAANLPRATARRILFTLEHRGYVVSDGKLFALTPQVLALAGSYMTSNQIITILQPVLDQISTDAQEISSLAVLQGSDVIFIARASPARVFSAGIDLGYRLPAYCSSVGRAMLGKYSNDGLTEVLDGMTLTAMTPFTVTDKESLKAAIITDREKGYSLVDREAEPGFRSISVPVRRYDDAIVAAINMGAHVDRVSTGEMIDRFLPLLRDAAATVKPLLL
jgi:IclR family pca regulon transcriptional regulator